MFFLGAWDRLRHLPFALPGPLKYFFHCIMITFFHTTRFPFFFKPYSVNSEISTKSVFRDCFYFKIICELLIFANEDLVKQTSYLKISVYLILTRTLHL